jgi:predicted ATPase
MALVEHAGTLVTKQQLVSSVWPERSPNDATLRWHVAELRRTLAATSAGPYIVSDQGRGYRFVATVGRETLPGPGIDLPHAVPIRGAMAPLTRQIGRAGLIQELAALLSCRRLVTIAGPGGMGKTRVATAVASMLAGARPEGAAFIDLADADPAALPSLIHPLDRRRMLLVLDGADRVTEALAPLVDQILAETPEVRVLVTSREPLGNAHESVCRLPGLETPPADMSLDAETALGFPSIELFVERARASVPAFALADGDAPIVATLCRRLDGMPLAIELAAGQVGYFGLSGLLERLHDRSAILDLGRRTATIRHRTLRDMLDWSYQTLGDKERLILARLSMLPGAFTLAAADAVCFDARIEAQDVRDGVRSLVSKSLLTVGRASDGAIYRLLDTTRDYAQEKLAEMAEAGRMPAHGTSRSLTSPIPENHRR